MEPITRPQIVQGTGFALGAKFLQVHSIRSDEGAKFTPWTDGWAIGFKVEADGKPTKYIALNPSGGSDLAEVDETCVFVYLEDEKFLSDGYLSESVCYVDIWEKA